MSMTAYVGPFQLQGKWWFLPNINTELLPEGTYTVKHCPNANTTYDVQFKSTSHPFGTDETYKTIECRVTQVMATSSVFAATIPSTPGHFGSRWTYFDGVPLDFGDEPQTVDGSFYKWFLRNATRTEGTSYVSDPITVKGKWFIDMNAYFTKINELFWVEDVYFTSNNTEYDQISKRMDIDPDHITTPDKPTPAIYYGGEAIFGANNDDYAGVSHRIIDFGETAQYVSDEFQWFLRRRAVQLDYSKMTTIQGSWKWNLTSNPSKPFVENVSFVSNGTIFSRLIINPYDTGVSDLIRPYIFYDNNSVGHFTDGVAKEMNILNFGSGVQVTTDFYEWFTANAIAYHGISGKRTIDANLIDYKDVTVNATFVSNGVTYHSMRLDDGTNRLYYDTTSVLNRYTWADTAYSTVDFGNIEQLILATEYDWLTSVSEDAGASDIPTDPDDPDDILYGIAESTLISIADAIRLRTGTTAPIKCSEFSAAIENLQGQATASRVDHILDLPSDLTITLKDNTIYTISNVATLTIEIPSTLTDYSAHMYIKFADIGPAAVIFPTGVNIYGSDPTLIQNDDEWEINFDSIGGVLCYRKVSG